MMNLRDAEKGTYYYQPTYCTVNCRGPHDCPYSDANGICHAPDPMKDCEEFAMFFDGSWADWLALGEDNDFPEEDYETGYDPYAGCFTDDC